MKNERSILNFQDNHTIVTQDDYYTFRVVLQNLLQKEIYNDLKAKAEKILFLNTFDELCEDIFYSYYNKKLEVRPENFIKLRFLLNHKIISSLIESKTHKERRTGVYSTIQSEISSFQVLLVDIEEIIEKIDEYLKSKQKNELDRLSDKINTYEKNKNEAGKNIVDGEKDDVENAPISGAIDDETLRNEFKKWLEINDKTIEDAVTEGVKEAKNKVTESEKTLNKVLGGFQQGHEEGILQKMPIHQRIELARLLSTANKLQEIVEYLGRFRIIAQTKQIEKLSEVKIEPTEITTGGDLSKALPMEFAKVGGDELTRKDFLLRWSQNHIWQTDPPPEKDKENLGKGSIIICVDTSGSMSGIKEYKSKALALAVAEVAYQQKRNFACILFDTKAYDPVVIDPDEKIDTIVNKVISLSQDFYGGGTDFEPPLNQAVEIIEKDEFNNADILFLTDGFSILNNKFLEKYRKLKEEKQFKTIGLLLDDSDIERNEGKHELEKFCDDIKFNSLIENDPNFDNSEDVANDIFLLL
jgi:uncharacterized protein with von Willebrand factor type A (vWA) domain